MKYNKKILLMILDGLGVAPQSNGNAVTLTKPPNLTRLWDTYPRTYLEASGESVGLLEGTNGNSEVGHLTIGSGKIHYQNLLKINNAISKGLFFNNQTLRNVLEHSIKNNSKIHLMGCLSDGAVHSHISHFIATVDFLKKNNYQGELIIHAFTDGRDTPQRSAIKYLELIDIKLKEAGFGRIGSICGRAYAMDRNKIFERTQKATDLLLKGKGYQSRDWLDAINKAYGGGYIDEYIEPICIFDKKPEESIIKDGDSIFFINFRPDRAIQLTKSILESNLKNIFFVGMTEYEKGIPKNILFPKEYLSLPLGRIISESGLRQLRIAESEKFPHVTYFLNGGQPIQYQKEERINVPSVKVATYDLKPEMSAYEIFKKLQNSITERTRNYDFIAVNIANCDMVGHTGNIPASIKAVQVVDDIVLKTVKLAQGFGWTTIITSDHGNVERMIDTQTGLPNTEHTQNPVPLLILDNQIRKTKPIQLKLGSLSDIAPTILTLMGLEKSASMTGKTLV